MNNDISSLNLTQEQLYLHRKRMKLKRNSWFNYRETKLNEENVMTKKKFWNLARDGKKNYLGIYVHAIRKISRMSQRKLAELLYEYGYKTTPENIAKIEKGQYYISDIFIEAFNEAMDVDIIEFRRECEWRKQKNNTLQNDK